MLKNAGVLIAALAALPLFLTACGGDGSPEAAPSKPTGQSTRPEAPGGAIVTETNQPSGPPPKPPAGSIDRGKVLEYARCMRANGLKDFPDPDASGALQMNGDVINPTSPQFQKAQRKCGHLMPGPGAPTTISTRGPDGGS